MFPSSRKLNYFIGILLIVFIQALTVLPVFAAEPEDILALVNQARANVGLNPLKLCSSMNIAAQRHSEDMAARAYFSHTALAPSPYGDGIVERLTNAGFNGNSFGENLASGYTDAAGAFNGWMNSEGHRANILRDRYQWMGLGRVNNLWTQTFGSGGSVCGTPATGGTGSGSGGSSTSSSSSALNLVVATNVPPRSCANNNVLISGGFQNCDIIGINAIGFQSIISQGVIGAVNIWGALSGSVTVCIPGVGRAIFIRADVTPNVQEDIASVAQNGYTCVNVSTIGQVVIVANGAPTSSSLASAPQQPTAPTFANTVPTTAQTITTPSLANGQNYAVQRGDTLSAVARRFGTTVNNLVVANNIANANLIFIGQVLVIR